MPMLRAARAVSAVAVAAVVSLGLVHPAAAGPADTPRKPVRTTVEITPPVMYGLDGSITVQGRVESRQPACEARRKVMLSGTDSFGQTFDFRPRRAARDGAFRFELPPPGPIDVMSFTASVERLRTSGARPVVCTAASDTLTLFG